MTTRHLTAMRDYVTSLGAKDCRIEWGKRHPKLRFTWRGEPRIYALPASPSCARWEQNAKSNLRRMMR